MTSGAIAAMLSTILYSRRFFPYYVYNIIGGLDEEGNAQFAVTVDSQGKCVSCQQQNSIFSFGQK